jgi:hypothetical protein
MADVGRRARCPNGHPIGPNQVLVGHVACLGHGGGGHDAGTANLRRRGLRPANERTLHGAARASGSADLHVSLMAGRELDFVS